MGYDPESNHIPEYRELLDELENLRWNDMELEDLRIILILVINKLEMREKEVEIENDRDDI